MPETARGLTHWHYVIMRSARALGDVGELVSVGWVSALARGVPEGARQAQAAYAAALRSSR